MSTVETLESSCGLHFLQLGHGLGGQVQGAQVGGGEGGITGGTGTLSHCHGVRDWPHTVTLLLHLPLLRAPGLLQAATNLLSPHLDTQLVPGLAALHVRDCEADIVALGVTHTAAPRCLYCTPSHTESHCQAGSTEGRGRWGYNIASPHSTPWLHLTVHRDIIS